MVHTSGILIRDDGDNCPMEHTWRGVEHVYDGIPDEQTDTGQW